MTPVGVVWSLPAIQRGVILRLDGDRLRTMDECRSRHFHKQMGYCETRVGVVIPFQALHAVPSLLPFPVLPSSAVTFFSGRDDHPRSLRLCLTRRMLEHSCLKFQIRKLAPSRSRVLSQLNRDTRLDRILCSSCKL